MRTLAAGSRTLRRAPVAMLPMTAEGVVAAVAVATGLFPQDAAAVIAGAMFPLNVYFDLKQSLATGFGWPAFAAALILSSLVRSGTLAATLWLADDRRVSIAVPWARAARLATVALVTLFPSAVLMYLGVALRYAPFIWAGAAAGFFPAVVLNRRALALDAGAGKPRGSGIPEAPGFLAYAYLLSALGAAMSSLGRLSPLLVALLVACLGPLHALFLLGWREHLRAETYPGGGTLAAAVTVVGLVVFLGATGYDRVIRNASPVPTADAPGSLLLLGGVDSTSTTGALTELDPRDLGFNRESVKVLSYSAAGDGYTGSDTRADLDEVGAVVSRQVEAAPEPQLLLGHSQAALILDRIVARGHPAPDRSVVLAPPPPVPPPVVAPPPGRSGTGRVGGDIARAGAALLEAVGLQPYDIDAPASPTNLKPVVVIDKKVSRVAVWALGDSVWLDSDWRRPGEINLVAITDHVGVTNNGRALAAARTFLRGRAVEGDEVSWRGFVATVLRYAFEPWRPS
ncbi:MAG: hypothetical protein M3N53_13650 [Actinomycetota bacterium]|nr:hypothetical protein [Actinomycetota bacterium]